ncbi:pyrimidine/purine nucleoside phosphorylase [Reichenbachiella sp. MALMAid0571]|uniref:pyrimidine/purine nucleoside phosphorylase n=1 Tax=Reichenbachiella sp. MALMAid0571 TaxID=3143939 RepID=UPI0032DE763F
MISTNEYFDGNVKSLGYTSADGKSTIGVMEKGSYEFGTSSHETMTVIEGILEVKYVGEDSWISYGAGQSFEVKANSSFQVKTEGQSSYLCKYA